MEEMFAEVWRNLPLDKPLGIGTGRTVEAWLDYGRLQGFTLSRVVSSSERTAKLLSAMGADVVDLQLESRLAVYIDSADEVNSEGVCIKGGGGAMTLEKIIRSVASEFICMVSESKLKSAIGSFPLAIEVLPSVRSYVGRAILDLGGDPVYRPGFRTDSGNVVLDVYGLDYGNMSALESILDSMLGVVGHGLFYRYAADTVYVAGMRNFSRLK